MKKFKFIYKSLLYLVTFVSICVCVYLIYNMIIEMIIDPRIGLYSLIYGSGFIIILLILILFLLYVFKEILNREENRSGDEEVFKED
ncbi:MAG: Unknown protein [uncultured Campylobacterales bacterium]|uniref:Uncharacterized protein n=1 Tax=uncultured Campylobacterales bacterium TaxID=352960 RepID=A0A6S6SGP6_9BACT|nr:MAG: Unknown protein [uncultured Campylobacterales bacterium]